MKIGQLTSVHKRHDTRVFQKVSRSLAAAGHEVTLIVNDDQPHEDRDGVAIRSTGFVPRNRVQRIVGSQLRVYRAALALDADAYQLHDPELLPVGLLLKLRGKRVVFDSHEDVPVDIRSKHWLPAPLRLAIATAYAALERLAVSRFDAVISVTPHIVERLRRINRAAYLVTNYPIVEAEPPSAPASGKQLCYLGAIHPTWNLEHALRALASFPELRLALAGPPTPGYLERLQAEPNAESQLEYLGTLPRAEVSAVYAESLAGLALNESAQLRQGGGTLGNNKLFETMYAGLPLLCTDYPLWKQLVEETGCGIAVDPTDADAIEAAIRRLLDDPEAAQEMGRRGQQAVLSTYNWNEQAKVLLRVYEELDA